MEIGIDSFASALYGDKKALSSVDYDKLLKEKLDLLLQVRDNEYVKYQSSERH